MYCFKVIMFRKSERTLIVQGMPMFFFMAISWAVLAPA